MKKTVRKDLQIGQVYGGYKFTRKMAKFINNQMVSIRLQHEHGYTVDGDNNNFWSEEMFEK